MANGGRISGSPRIQRKASRNSKRANASDGSPLKNFRNFMRRPTNRTGFRPGDRTRVGAGAGPIGRDRQSALPGNNRGRSWVAQNAGTSNASSVVFTPLTDSLGALGGATDASISIGALTVQPGGTGVILAGTGDPERCARLLLRSGHSAFDRRRQLVEPDFTDQRRGSRDLGVHDVQFCREGFAGFAWSTVNPQLVVAAVSQAYEGTLVNAVQTGQQLRGALLLHRQRRDVASGDHYGRRMDRSCRDRWRRLRRRTAMRLLRWCGIRCGSCLWRRCAFTATTSRRTA